MVHSAQLQSGHLCQKRVCDLSFGYVLRFGSKMYSLASLQSSC